MSRRRRAALLLGLALALGGLAASDVAQREAALDRRLGPFVGVIVARSPLREGDAIAPARLAVRRVPVQFAPPQAFPTPAPCSACAPGRHCPRAPRSHRPSSAIRTWPPPGWRGRENASPSSWPRAIPGSSSPGRTSTSS